MHTKFSKFLGAMVLGLGAASFLFAAAHHYNGEAKLADASVGSYSTSISSYYSSSSTAYSGTQLLGQLHDLITSTHKTYTTYDDNGKNLYQQNTDQWYNASGSKVSGYLRDFYSGVQWPNAWAATAGNTSGGYNREHVWCQSLSIPSGSSSQLWGTTGGGSDMHHLRPTEVRINSTRNNNLYGTVSNRDSYKVYSKLGTNTTYALGGYLSGSVFEPIDSVKGDVARIVFYVYTHYNSYSVSAVFGSYASTNGSGSSSFFATSKLSILNLVSASSESAAWTMLMNWNNSDPVDTMEAKRNEQVAIYQGNRNPFIDYPQLANCCWGSSKWNWATRSTTSGSSTTTDSVSLNKSSLSLTVGNTATLTATASGTVTWSTSNSSVATVSGGTVTAKAAGSATITAKCGTASATCAVTVTSSSSGGSSSTTGSEYKVVFATATSDSSSALTTSTFLSSAVSSNALINSVSSVSRVYKGKSGLKFGTSSYAGSFTAVPVTAAKSNVTAIKITSTKYGSDTGTLTLSVNGSSVKTGITVGSDYTYTFSSASSVSSFGIATSAKRAYVGSVTFVVGSSSGSGSSTTTDSVSLNKSSLSLVVGNTGTITATASGTVTWSTSNSSVATVSNGTVTAKAAGTATITAKCGTATATCSVTVTASSGGSSSSSYHFENGKAYKMYFTKSSKNYYYTGTMTSYYGKTTTTKSSGVSVYFEANGSGQNLYYTKNGTKTYLYIYVSGSYPYFGTTTSTPSNVWTYNSSYSCMTMTVSGSVYTFAGYSSYFDAYAIGSASYKVNFVAA